MSKCILWGRSDGAVFRSIPMEPPLQGEPESMWLDRVALRAQAADPQLADCVRLDRAGVDAADLPTRRFRDCWRHAGGVVVVDVSLARAQVLAEVRRERNARLDASDREKARLDEIGTAEQRTALAAYRQKLRDLPAAVTTEVASLDADALAAYAPRWPVAD